MAPNSSSTLSLGQIMQSLVDGGNSLDSRMRGIQSLLQKSGSRHQQQAKELRERFLNLIQSSRRIAGVAKAAADDFREDMIMLILDQDTPVSEKTEELSNWNKIIQTKSQAAEKQPEEFKKLVGDLKNFSEVLSKEAADNDVALDRNIAELDARIRDIDDSIDRLIMNDVVPISQYIVGLVGRPFGYLISRIMRFPFAVLNYLRAIISKRPGMDQVTERIDQVEDKQQALNKERERLVAEHRALEKEKLEAGDASVIPQTVKTIAADIEAFASQLNAFTNIFTHLSQCQESIQSLLKEGLEVSDPKFKSQIQVIQEMLSSDSVSLGVFANSLPASASSGLV
ncbi:hypothetical protein ABKN59_004594 [Abortiporus biennis]